MDSSSNVFTSVEGEFSTPVIQFNGGYPIEEFNHIQDDWSSLTNMKPCEQITMDIQSNDPKLIYEAYSKLKEKNTQINENQKSLEKEFEDLKKYNTSFEQTIHDSLRLFGKNEEVALLTGKLCRTIKEEIETETAHIQSLIEENKLQKEKCMKQIQDYVKLLKECVSVLSEEERHAFENPYICGICVENNITHVFRPCGHTICQTCMNTQHLWNCHICRKHITEKIKVYFS